MEKSLVIGGANGIGLALATVLSSVCKTVFIVDKSEPSCQLPDNVVYKRHNLIDSNLKFLDEFLDVDLVFFSAGFGRVATFDSYHFKEIDNCFIVNTISPIKVINKFADRLTSKKDFYMGVMVSIAGYVSSPLFSLYGATKAALRSEIESVNIELEKKGTSNRILDISPGSLQGTAFNGPQRTQLDLLLPLAKDILHRILQKQTVFIPQYNETYKDVIARYEIDSHNFGLQSYDYKLRSGRMTDHPQIKIGYLSGTFDLFHIGHLNLLRKAKEHCDYLVVGIHLDASHKGKTTFIPFEERKAILESIKYVDRVIMSEKEDCDVFLKNIVHYDILFVGSDYKGTPRFKRYEEIFKFKGVKIIYFPYTKGTSSTQLRDALQKK